MRGEGEEIIVERMNELKHGRWEIDHKHIHGIAFHEGEQIIATQAASTIKDLDRLERTHTA